MYEALVNNTQMLCEVYMKSAVADIFIYSSWEHNARKHMPPCEGCVKCT